MRGTATKFLIGAGIGIPAASLCINRRLFRISRMNTANITRQEVRLLTSMNPHKSHFLVAFQRLRAVYEDIAIAIGFPVLVMILRE